MKNLRKTVIISIFMLVIGYCISLYLMSLGFNSVFAGQSVKIAGAAVLALGLYQIWRCIR